MGDRELQTAGGGQAAGLKVTSTVGMSHASPIYTSRKLTNSPRATKGNRMDLEQSTESWLHFIIPDIKVGNCPNSMPMAVRAAENLQKEK